MIDLADRQVTRDGEPVHLTPIEFDLLRVLAQHQGRLVTHRQLLREVWGPEYGDETHYLRVHVAHIRAKLEPDPSRPAVPDHRAGRRLPAARPDRMRSDTSTAVRLKRPLAESLRRPARSLAGP